jgi:hypothetical protein
MHLPLGVEGRLCGCVIAELLSSVQPNSIQAGHSQPRGTFQRDATDLSVLMWEDLTQLPSQTRCQVIPCGTFHLIIYAWYPLLGFWHKVHITDTADQLLDVANNQLHLVGQEAAAEAGGFNTDNLQRPSTTQIRSWAAAAQEARLRHATYNSSSSPASATAAIESTGCSSTRIV